MQDIDYILEIAQSHSGHQNVRLTDFFFKIDTRSGASVHERYKVVETATPSRIIGGEVIDFRYSYVVWVWRSTGWREVIYCNQDHAATALEAVSIAEQILGA